MRRESELAHECLTIGMMAKYWEPGCVKTRLGAAIGMKRAAQIHRIFVAHLCKSLRDSADQRIVSFSPIDRAEQLHSVLDHSCANWSVVDQGTGDLGARMKRWFARYLNSDNSRAILLGADLPTIGPDSIALANQALVRNDLVIGPARDGGYYLIGLRGDWEKNCKRFSTLFDDMPWSTPAVLEVTRSRAQTQGISIAELESDEDVDTIVELKNLLMILGDEDADLRSAIESIMSDPTLDDSTLADSTRADPE